MMGNNDIIVKQYLSLKVINLQYNNLANEEDVFFSQASSLLSMKGYELIKKSYINSKMIFALKKENGNISFTNANNEVLPYILKDSFDNCSCYMAKCNMMQCKHIISLSHKFDISKIGLC